MAVTEDGDLVGLRYRLVERVGSGAMGVVWQAQDEVLRRTVAVKELLLHWGMSEAQTEEARRRAMREGRIAARLHHPNAISVYDVVEHEGRPCLIMEYLPSESLSDLLAKTPTLPPVDVARIGSQIASALAAAHDAGIVHRDVKPGNVLLAEDGTAKLTDFGISRAVGDATVTATGVLAGTPAYLAPEIAQGYDAGFPSDVFSLGATLYAAVEGVPPFGLNDNPMALLHYISTNEITPPKQAGPLTATLVWMLTRDPDRRPTMREAGQALEALAGSGEDRAPAIPVAAGAAALAPTAVSTAVAAPVVVPAAAAAPLAATKAVSTPVPPATTQPSPVRPAAAPAQSGSNGPNRKRAYVIIGLVAAVLLTTGILIAVMNDGGGQASGGPATSTTTKPTNHPGVPAATSAAKTTTKQQPTSAVTPTTKSVPPTTAPTTTTPTAPAGSGTGAGNPPPATPGELANTISQYYKLLPGGVDQGWSWMTASYQQNHAHGFAAYKSFWAEFSRVTATNVHVTSGNNVFATINYTYKDGRTESDDTTFGMVAQDNQWKINTSSK
jgi:hypothetical protein